MAFYGHEIAGSPCLNVVHAQPSAAEYTAEFKILRNIVRTRNACREISNMFTQAWPLTGPVDCPRASCDLGIKYLMLRSHA